MTVDMSKYLGLFVSESLEHLDALGRDMVLLEKGASAEVIDSAFRHAHSVKGMAASMGFESTAALAHRMEDLFDAVRADLSRLDRSVVDLILSAIDAVTGHVKACAEGQPVADVSELLAQLGQKLSSLTGAAPQATRVVSAVATVAAHSAKPAANDDVPPPATPPVSLAPVSSAGAGGSPPPSAPPAVSAAALSGANGSPAPTAPLPPASHSSAAPVAGAPRRFVAKVRIAASCAVPGVRAFLVYKKLSSLGTIVELRPPLEEVKAGRLSDGTMSIELETAQGSEGIAGAIKLIPDAELVSVGEPVAHEPAPAPKAAATPAVVPEPAKAGYEGNRTVRVRTELLDYFLDIVGELFLATARIRESSKDLPDEGRSPLDESVDHLHGLVKDLHDKVMKSRMTPISLVTDRLPRAARDIARRRDRDVDLTITGAEIELDRAIVDDLVDPMLHILRNCIDHGIETLDERAKLGKPPAGRIQVKVRRVKDRVAIEVEDDGRGMDAERLKAVAISRGLLTPEAAERLTEKEAFMLCCLPNVSTAQAVSDISGRGVGMDAVKRTIEGVGGTLDIESQRGRGTRFILTLPLTVAVVNLLLVEAGQEIFGLPVAKVLAAIETDPGVLSRSQDNVFLPHGTGLVPVHGLAELLRIPSSSGAPSPEALRLRPFVLMDVDAGKVALAVDKLLGQQELVIKAVSRPLHLVPGLAGVTILGTGRPVFILDVPRLFAA